MLTNDSIVRDFFSYKKESTYTSYGVDIAQKNVYMRCLSLLYTYVPIRNKFMNMYEDDQNCTCDDFDFFKVIAHLNDYHNISETFFHNVLSELSRFKVFLFGGMGLYQKAKLISMENLLYTYSRLLDSFDINYSNSKLVRRFGNLQEKSKKFLEHKIRTEQYEDELKYQQKYIARYVEQLASVNLEHLFIGILRYDYKKANTARRSKLKFCNFD